VVNLRSVDTITRESVVFALGNDQLITLRPLR
jgi:hypothetical protein